MPRIFFNYFLLIFKSPWNQLFIWQTYNDFLKAIFTKLNIIKNKISFVYMIITAFSKYLTQKNIDFTENTFCTYTKFIKQFQQPNYAYSMWSVMLRICNELSPQNTGLIRANPAYNLQSLSANLRYKPNLLQT